MSLGVFYPKSWAQDTLFAGIRILKGDLCIQESGRAIADARYLQSWLRAAGYPKQAVTLGRWISRASVGSLKGNAHLARRSCLTDVREAYHVR